MQAFGQAAGQAFSDTLTQIKAVGQQIAGLQSGIINEQVAYQTAQYNEQLRVARRTLSDINGLTGRNFGGLGSSYLGQLEKENLALSRQGQLLQFNLQQRQINFQVALAGFQAPGVTPEERQARVKEAQIEASYAQKQLDIQRQMFGNQVQIVDISNLRQGVDLAKQIGLLLQGRRVTIDVAVKQQELIRAQQRSEQLVKQAGTYLSAVDTLAATAISHIQEMEVAAGRALSRVEVMSVKLVNKYFQDLTAVWTGFFSGGMTGTENHPGKAQDDVAGPGKASGFLGNVSGASPITVGEAGTETVAVLRNPRAFLGGGNSGGNSVNFYGDLYFEKETDLDLLARKVQKAMGQKASAIGLRSGG